MNHKLKTSALFLGSLLVAASAQAHTGVGSTSGFLHGIEHPLGGLDHLLAMVAIGLWAAQLGGRAMWALPATFVSVMALGGLLGMVGISVPFVEFGILASVLGLGVFIAAAMKLPLPVTLAIAAFFALFHGYAHGVEMPAMASGWAYAAGLVISTLALHACGLAAGMAFKILSSPTLTRLAGAGVAACALWLIIF